MYVAYNVFVQTHGSRKMGNSGSLADLNQEEPGSGLKKKG